MPYIIVLFAWRRPDISPDDFKQAYETSHMPLLKSIAGSTFPITHTRHYIQRSPALATANPDGSHNYPATALVGSPEEFEYDAYSELVFDDADTFKEFLAKTSEPEAAARIAENEAMFLQREKLKAVVVDDVMITS